MPLVRMGLIGVQLLNLVYKKNLQLCLCRTTAPTKELQKEHLNIKGELTIAS